MKTFFVSCLKASGIDSLAGQMPCVSEKYQKEIKMNLYTAILFYGTLKEKALAEVKLKELTKKHLNSPKSG
jgi:hypothetical protein